MAWSDPEIESVDIPDEAPPNNTFRVSATIRQGGPDPWASEGSCTSRNLDISGWETPVKLFVNGEEVDSEELCLSSGNTREASLSASLPSEGTHSVRVVVEAVGGNAYDLKGRQEKVNDEVKTQIEATPDARDPSQPSAFEAFRERLESLADSLGATTTQVAIGMALALAFMVVV